jgi:phospholipid-translocating ATPase
MIFRQCSVSGKVYKGDPTSDDSESTLEKKMSTSTTEPARSVTIPVSQPESDSTAAPDPGATAPLDDATTITPLPVSAEKVKLSPGVLKHFRDEILKADLADAVSAGPNSEGAPRARALNGFFVVLALCHTVLTSVDPKTGAIEYKAQSPDEAALVQAAADVGFIFRGRDREILSLQTPFSDEIERYELLNILEFTSARKRMSVVLRKLDGEDGRLFLLTKGADNVIFERLRSGNDELKEITERHLDEFASEGLRTLTLAYKVIPGQFIPLFPP